MEGSAAAPAEAMEAHLPLPQPTDVELILGMRNTFGGTGQWMHQINQMKAAMHPDDLAARKILCHVDGECAYIVRPANVSSEDPHYEEVYKGGGIEAPKFVHLVSQKLESQRLLQGDGLSTTRGTKNSEPEAGLKRGAVPPKLVTHKR